MHLPSSPYPPDPVFSFASSRIIPAASSIASIAESPFDSPVQSTSAITQEEETTMTSPASLHSLPVEIISYIFELAWQGLAADYSHWRDEHTRREPYKEAERTLKKFTPTGVLAALQISSRTRSINEQHPPFWRAVSDIVLLSVAHRQHDDTLRFLKLCANSTNNSLIRFYLDDFEKSQRKGCILRMPDFIKCASKSAPHLKALHLQFLPDWMIETCDCSCCIEERKKKREASHSTQRPGNRSIPAVNDAVFALICKATSLDELALRIGALPSLRWMTDNKDVKAVARPRSLQLKFESGRVLTPEQLTLFIDLASSAERLYLDAATADRDGVLLKTLLPAAIQTLRELVIYSHQYHFDFGPLLLHDFTKVTKLWIRGPRFTAPAVPPGTIFSFPSLVENEGPSWLLAFLEGPQLQRVAVTFIGSSVDATGMINSLKQWPKVKDLVIHAQTLEQECSTKIFQQIIRALTPSAASDKCLCPVLERLAITTKTGSPDGIAQAAFNVDERLTDDQFFDQDWDLGGACRSSAAIIGTDLSSLVQKRCSPPSSSDQASSSLPWLPLTTVAVAECLVDPVAWQRILDLDLVPSKWCYPDPHKFEGPLSKRETELFASVGRADQEFEEVPTED